MASHIDPFAGLGLSPAAHIVLAEEGIETLDALLQWADYASRPFHDAFRDRPAALREEIHRAVAAFLQARGCAFQLRYVAYLDILGFTQSVERADSSEAERDLIRSSLGTFRERIARYPNPDLQFSQFSDNIVLSAPRGENGLLYLLEMVIRIWFDLFLQGVLVRGGIVLGNLEHNEHLIFGSGLIAAHRLDARGGPPRIVLDDAFLADWRASRLGMTIWPAAVREDAHDLASMVHTLLYAQTYRPDMGHPWSFADAERIVATMRARSTDMTKPADVRAKWRWLGRYWNDVVAGHGRLPSV